MRSIPAARARAMTASSSLAKSGKSRWQWLSISICVLLRGCRLDIARENRCRRWKLCTRGDAVVTAKMDELPLGRRNRQQIKQFLARSRHERQYQYRHLA